MYSFSGNHWMVVMPCGLLLAGCTLFEPSQPTPTVVVTPPATAQHEQVVMREPVIIHDAPPPPPRTEVIASAPSPQHVWVPGYWTQREGGWVWQPGHWELSP
ncbi:MAG: YXWGXW repeat-containing protein [Candidatus Competibacter sp.]|jgi:hypothetical protein|nr:YXWGXW repeat-containing protein [Candidatus Competibacter sp.]